MSNQPHLLGTRNEGRVGPQEAPCARSPSHRRPCPIGTGKASVGGVWPEPLRMNSDKAFFGR